MEKKVFGAIDLTNVYLHRTDPHHGKMYDRKTGSLNLYHSTVPTRDVEDGYTEEELIEWHNEIIENGGKAKLYFFKEAYYMGVKKAYVEIDLLRKRKSFFIGYSIYNSSRVIDFCEDNGIYDIDNLEIEVSTEAPSPNDVGELQEEDLRRSNVVYVSLNDTYIFTVSKDDGLYKAVKEVDQILQEAGEYLKEAFDFYLMFE
jgi:hypothetical protein